MNSVHKHDDSVLLSIINGRLERLSSAFLEPVEVLWDERQQNIMAAHSCLSMRDLIHALVIRRHGGAYKSRVGNVNHVNRP